MRERDAEAAVAAKVEEAIKGVFADGALALNGDTNLPEIGMNSLMFINMVIRLEADFGISLPDEELLIGNFTTVRQVTDMVIKSGGAAEA